MSNDVVMFDATRANEPIWNELKAAFNEVMGSGKYIMGPAIDGFEKDCASHLGVKHALTCSNGTDALLLALMAVDIGPGDEVICPAYTFFATAGSIWRVGAKPVFVDVDLGCFNLTSQAVEAAITPKTKAILPVHLFGQPAEMGALMQLANKHNLVVIEDVAQAMGSTYGDKKTGTIGSMGCFSFFPTKNLGGYGDGGLITTNDDALAAKLKALRCHGEVHKYAHEMVGGNFRMDTLQAAFLQVKLKHLEAYTEARVANANYYIETLVNKGVAGFTKSDAWKCAGACAKPVSQAQGDKPLLLPRSCPQRRHVYNQFVVRVPGDGKRDALKKHLQEQGVHSAIYYPAPLHVQKAFASLEYKQGDFPVSEQLSRETLALPIYSELTEAERARVVDVIVSFF